MHLPSVISQRLRSGLTELRPEIPGSCIPCASRGVGTAQDYGQGYPHPCCGVVPCWLHTRVPTGSLPRAGSVGERWFVIGAPGATGFRAISIVVSSRSPSRAAVGKVCCYLLLKDVSLRHDRHVSEVVGDEGLSFALDRHAAGGSEGEAPLATVVSFPRTKRRRRDDRAPVLGASSDPNAMSPFLPPSPVINHSSSWQRPTIE